MQFYRTEASTGVNQLHEHIHQSLKGDHRVLWLVSGGSNIPIATEVMTLLADTTQTNLTIVLSDERYDMPGHADSNAQQLQAAGFNPGSATFIPVLIGEPLEATTNRYNDLITQQFERHEVIIGQFGIGADGHIAGILPHSPAITVTDRLVTQYSGEDFIRITLTFPALRAINKAFVFAYGETKHATLKQLRDDAVALEIQPAQILKAIPQTYIYNDELEGMV